MTPQGPNLDPWYIMMLSEGLASLNIFPRRSGPVHVEGRGYWHRIADALAESRDGDVIRIQPGDYVETLVIRKNVAIAAAKSGVRIVGTKNEPVIRVEAEATLTGIEVVSAAQVRELEAVAVRGGRLTLQSCSIRSTCAGVTAAGSGSFLRLTGCRVMDTGANAVVFANGAEGECEETGIERVAGIGILVAGPGAQVHVQRSGIRNTTGFGMQVRDGATATVLITSFADCQMSAFACRDPETRVQFHENQVHDAGDHGVEVGDCPKAIITGNRIDRTRLSGISVYGPSSRATVASNFITNSGGHAIQVIEGASAEVRDNLIADALAAGVAVGEPGTRAVIEGNQVARVAAGVQVVNQGWADIRKNKIDSTGHCIYVRGPESFARVVTNQLSSPVPEDMPEDGPGATFRVAAGEIAVVFVHKKGAAVVQGNELVGGKAPIAWITGASVETEGNVQRTGDILHEARTGQYFSEDVFK
ncbi:MAG: hypothetical protein AMXMBFR80_09390 [Dehalococcoidia bacterium]